MSFSTTLSRSGASTLIKIHGELDALTASTFRAELDRAAQDVINHLVLDMTHMSYLSSSGLRTLVYARHKLGSAVRIVLVGTNEAIQRTIRLVGFQHSLEFSDAAEAFSA